MEKSEILLLSCFIIQTIIFIYMLKIYLDSKDLKNEKASFDFLTNFKLFSWFEIIENEDCIKKMSTKKLDRKKHEMIATLFLTKEVITAIKKMGLKEFEEWMKKEEDAIYLVLEEISNRKGEKDMLYFALEEISNSECADIGSDKNEK